MKQIQLTQGKMALVDDADYEWLNQWKWYAQYYNHTYYARRNSGQIKLFMHRIILNAPSGVQTDHVNGNGLDNRRLNLRFCTNAENSRHQRLRPVNTTGFKGVWINRQVKQKRYRANIRVNYKIIHLGCYHTAKAAAEAYDVAALKHFSGFALTNRMLGLL